MPLRNIKLRYTFICLFAAQVAGSKVAGQTYFLNGSATFIGNDCYQLTSELNTQNGTVWYGEQIDLEQPFDLSFLMNFGVLDGNGADGICFVLQTVGTMAIGESGGGLGYLNFGTSLGIEFDTWQNGEYGDPWEDHIAIQMNGDINHNSDNNIAGPVQADPFNVNIEDGDDHVVRITWNPDTQEISVYFDCVFRLQGEIDLVNSIFGGENLVYWGFTAATGGAYNNQTVCLQENIVTTANEVIICEGASANLSAGSSLDGIYTWSPADYLSSTETAVVVATPPVTTTYTVAFTDLCGEQNELEITVVVEDLEATLSGIETINCVNPTVSINADLNYTAGAYYTWTLNDIVLVQGYNLNNLDTWNWGMGELLVNVQDVCFDTVQFEIPSDFTTYTADAGNDAVINCYADEVTLSANTDGDDAQIVWLLNDNLVSTQADYTTSVIGTYYLTVVNPSSGCATADTVALTEDYSTPEVFIPVQDTLSCLQPQVVISNVAVNSENEYGVLWSTAEGSIVNGANTLNATVSAEGYYELTATDLTTGCATIATVYIEEEEELNIDPSLILFPNITTPNSDGLNDLWHPFLSIQPERDVAFFFSQYDLKIYNRWGNLVFETTSASDAWTGRDLAEGVYYYHIAYKTLCSDGSEQVREGHVQLVR